MSMEVLKACAMQLCGVMWHIFNLSLRLEKVPTQWKASGLVPVAKKGNPKVLDYGPVALIFHVIKILKRLIPWSAPGQS